MHETKSKSKQTIGLLHFTIKFVIYSVDENNGQLNRENKHTLTYRITDNKASIR